MNIGSSFSFVFEDDRWVTKILIAAAILAVGWAFFWLLGIPLILAILLLSGYQVEITRRVIRGGRPLLPEWDDWGKLLVDGVKFAVIGLVYALPAIIVSICVSVPISLLGDSGNGDMSWVGAACGGPVACLTALWGILVTLVLPAAVAKWVVSDDLAAAFRFGEVFRFAYQNLSTYIVLMIMTWVASLIGGLGTVVCLIGWLATYPYSIMVTGHLYGEAYLAATVPPAAPQPVSQDDSPVS